MLSHRVFCAGAIAIASFLVPYSAQADGYTSSLKDEPAPAETYLWNGPYIGVGIGIGSFDHDLDVSGALIKQWQKHKCRFDHTDKHALKCEDWKDVGKPNSGSSNSTFGDDDWDVFGTIQVGYDRLFHDRFLLGVLADYDFYQDADNTISAKILDGKHTIGSVKGSLELDDVWSVGGRAGFLVTPRILLYGTGGYSQADIEGSTKITVNGGPGVNLDTSDDMDGYFVGGGGEIKLDRNLSLKLEYRYTDLNGDTASASSTANGPVHSGCGHKTKYGCTEYRKQATLNGKTDLDAEIHSVRIALVMKLGEPEHAPPAPLK